MIRWRAHEKKEHWHYRKTSRTQVDLTDTNNVEALRNSLKRVPSYSWDLDVHRHVEYLHRSITWKARRLAHKPTHTWKEHLQEETWLAVNDKSQARKRFFYWKDKNRVAQLRLVWMSWRGDKRDDAEKFLTKSNFELAKAPKLFRTLTIKAQCLVRRDDNVFLKSFVERVEDSANQGDTKRFWQQLRRFLPRHKGKRMGAGVKQNEMLKEQWAPHVCQMEAGTTIDAENGLQNDLSEVPSLLAIEWTLRESKPGRQGGMDKLEPSWVKCAAKELAPLLWRISLKQQLWGVEAVQFKGGALSIKQ